MKTKYYFGKKNMQNMEIEVNQIQSLLMNRGRTGKDNYWDDIYPTQDTRVEAAMEYLDDILNRINPYK